MSNYHEYCKYIWDREIKSCTDYNNTKRLEKIEAIDSYKIKSPMSIEDQEKIYNFMINHGIPHTDIEFGPNDCNEIYYALHIHKVECPEWFKNKYRLYNEPSFMFLEGVFLSNSKNADSIEKEKWLSEIVNCMKHMEPNDHEGYHVRKFEGMMWSIDDPKHELLQELFRYAESDEIDPCLIDTLLQYINLHNDNVDCSFVLNIKYDKFEKMKKIIRYQLIDYCRDKDSTIYYKFHRFNRQSTESVTDDEIDYE
jgi:hypothetical protein